MRFIGQINLSFLASQLIISMDALGGKLTVYK